jgi:hypothetical protein
MTMKKILFKSVLAAALFALAGNAAAVKDIDSLTGSSNQSAAGKAIQESDILAAVKEVCRVWNTSEMEAILDPAFSDTEAFISSAAILPNDARLVFFSLGEYKITSKDVTVEVRVAIEYSQGGNTITDTPREVSWTFKRYD